MIKKFFTVWNAFSLVFLIALAFVIAWPPGASAQSQGDGTTKVSRTPVTITYVIKNFDERGRPAEDEVMVQAFRSDGSSAQYKLSTTGTPSIRSVADYRARIGASVDPLIKAVVKKPLTTAPRIAATCEGAYGPGNCKGPAPETILAFKLENVTVSDHPLGYVQDYLVAPDLDYVYLKRTDKDETGLTFAEWQAVDVRTGEPDARLFDIPADYEVVARNVYYDRGMRARGKAAQPSTVEMFHVLDEGRYRR